MKRKDIVTKLVKEGLSEKILATMSDKHFNMLAERILGEQSSTIPPINTATTSANSQNKVMIAKNSPTSQSDIDTAKKQKKTIEVYEELGEPKLGTKPKNTDDKENVIKRLKFKIEHSKDKNKVEDAKKLLAKLTKKHKEMAEGEFKSKTEWLKSKGIIKDDKKKEETTEDSDTAEATPENKKEKGEKKEKKDTKGGGGFEYEKRLAKGNAGGFSLNEWVSKIVDKKIHPFTSKNEIMELIQSKLTEQTEVMDPETTTLPDFLTFDAIKGSGAAEPATKPTTKPGTKPTTRPTPKTPYQPGPGPKHNPKATAMKK